MTASREQSALMLFESHHLRVTADSGTATLWLGFPGSPVNALDIARLRELDSAIIAISQRRVRILVVRSAMPAGFCAGVRPEAFASLTHPTERAAFSWYGQQVLDRLARLDAVSVAYIDGPCLGAGLELALACDRRVCVSRPTTHLGFPDRYSCFGGSVRLRHLIGNRADRLLGSGETLSGREARSLGFVDVACCERRGKIELRSLLDVLESRPVKAFRPELFGLAAERAEFAQRTPQASETPITATTLNPLQPFPEVVALLGDDPEAARILGEAVLRGGSAVVVCGNRNPVFAHIDKALTRGFITPLEAEEARCRVRASDSLKGFDRAGLVFVAHGHDAFRLAAMVRPRTVVCLIRPPGGSPVNADIPAPFPFPRRVVRLGFCEAGRVALFPGPGTHPDTTATVAAWLKPSDLTATVFPLAARVLPRAA